MDEVLLGQLERSELLRQLDVLHLPSSRGVTQRGHDAVARFYNRGA